MKCISYLKKLLIAICITCSNYWFLFYWLRYVRKEVTISSQSRPSGVGTCMCVLGGGGGFLKFSTCFSLQNKYLSRKVLGFNKKNRGHCNSTKKDIILSNGYCFHLKTYPLMQEDQSFHNIVQSSNNLCCV